MERSRARPSFLRRQRVTESCLRSYPLSITTWPSSHLHSQLHDSVLFLFLNLIWGVPHSTQVLRFPDWESNPCPLQWEAWSLNHWITREVLMTQFLSPILIITSLPTGLSSQVTTHPYLFKALGCPPNVCLFCWRGYRRHWKVVEFSALNNSIHCSPSPAPNAYALQISQTHQGSEGCDCVDWTYL